MTRILKVNEFNTADITGQRQYDGKNANVVFTGKEEDRCGILHTWHVDAPSASFSHISPGVYYEILVGSDPYKMDLDDKVANEMDKGTASNYIDDDTLECWYRIW